MRVFVSSFSIGRRASPRPNLSWGKQEWKWCQWWLGRSRKRASELWKPSKTDRCKHGPLGAGTQGLELGARLFRRKQSLSRGLEANKHNLKGHLSAARGGSVVMCPDTHIPHVCMHCKLLAAALPYTRYRHCSDMSTQQHEWTPVESTCPSRSRALDLIARLGPLTDLANRLP